MTNKGVYLGLLAAMTVLGMGCAEQRQASPSSSGGGDGGGGAVLGPNDYHLRGLTDGDGSSCTTGVRRFKTRREMCFGLMDPEANKECALMERIDRFRRDCNGEGVMFARGARVCELALVRSDRHVLAVDDLPPERVVRRTRFYVGYDRQGREGSEALQLNHPFYQGMEVFVSMAYAPSHSAEFEPQVDATFSIVSPVDGDNQNSPVRRNLRLNANIWSVSSFSTSVLGEPGHVFLACRNFWACDMPIKEIK